MRVLLFDLPPLLRDILTEAFAGEADISILGDAPGRGDLASQVRLLTPDIVVLGASVGDAEATARELHAAVPRIAIVVIAPHGDHATVFRRDDTPITLTDVSPTSLLVAIRDYCAVNDSAKLPPAPLS